MQKGPFGYILSKCLFFYFLNVRYFKAPYNMLITKAQGRVHPAIVCGTSGYGRLLIVFNRPIYSICDSNPLA